MQRTSTSAFTLTEVVAALGICVFALVSLVALFGSGLRDRRESRDELQAANLVSQIIVARLAAPSVSGPDVVIPAAALTGSYAAVYSSSAPGYVHANGKLLATPADAAYSVVCLAGTSSATGPNLSQVYIMLSWPAMAKPNTAIGKYEIQVTIPPNTTATAYVPAKNGESVTESGKPAAAAEGVQFLRMEKNTAVYAVGSGTYQFLSTLP